MGLFTNTKKGCPICGEPTPRLFPTKIEGTPICKTCAKKVSLPEGMLERMNLNAFGAYIRFHDNNAALREQFTEEYCFDVDGWNDEIQIDLSQKLFRVSDKDNAIVFQGSCIQSFQILQDGQPLLEGDASGLKAYPSDVPNSARQLQPTIDSYIREKRNYERMEQVCELIADEEKKEERLRELRRQEPRFDPVMPMEQFHILLNLEHPYWPTFEGKLDGPSFNTYQPDVDDYIRAYQEKADALAELAKNLMKLFAANAPIRKAGTHTAAPAAPSGDAIAQIKSFKELLDLGIITEEEFAAKKRELLGL